MLLRKAEKEPWKVSSHVAGSTPARICKKEAEPPLLKKKGKA